MAEEGLKQKTKKGLYWKFAEQFSNYGVQFVVGIFMARMLSQDDLGIVALAAVFMGISEIFVNSGFSAALVRKPQLKEEDLSTAFYYSISIGALLYIILFIASPYIADYFNSPALKTILRVTAISFLYSPFGTPQSVLLLRRLDFKIPTMVSVVCRIISGIVGVVMVYIGYGIWALVIPGMVSGIVGIIIEWIVVRWIPKTAWSKESFSYLWNYGNKLMGSWLIGTIYEKIAPFLIGKHLSPAQLAVYDQAEKYSRLPSQNLTGTLQSVTFPVLSKLQNDEERLANAYRKILRVTAFVVFPLMMMMSALARPLIITVITAKWESSIILLQILCFAMMWYPIHAINLNLLEVKGRSDLFFRLEVIKRVIGVCILCCTLPFGLVSFCFGSVLVSLLCLFVNTYYTGKIINLGYLKQMGDLLPALILSVFVFIIIQAVYGLVSNMILQIVVGVVVGGTVYLGAAWLLKYPELQDAKYLISKRMV